MLSARQTNPKLIFVINIMATTDWQAILSMRHVDQNSANKNYVKITAIQR